MEVSEARPKLTFNTKAKAWMLTVSDMLKVATHFTQLCVRKSSFMHEIIYVFWTEEEKLSWLMLFQIIV